MELLNKLKIFKRYEWTIFVIIIFAIFFRIYVFSFGRSLWHDECSLALSLLDRNIFDYFRPLEHYQCAPAFFMVLSNVLVKLFGLSEYSLRLLPLLSGLVSLPVFYLLTKSCFKNKLVLLLINILFAFNYQLISYSQEFKQYSTDVLIIILLLLIFRKIDLFLINKKQFIIYALVIGL